MRKKSRQRFLFICIFRKYMFCVQLYGKWACWGCYNLYFEDIKALLLKTHLIFSWFLHKMSPGIILRWSNWGPQPQSIKSLLSPCDYTIQGFALCPTNFTHHLSTFYCLKHLLYKQLLNSFNTVHFFPLTYAAFLKKILCESPNRRYTIAQIKKDRWIKLKGKTHSDIGYLLLNYTHRKLCYSG